jgi:hypothetical protein
VNRAPRWPAAATAAILILCAAAAHAQVQVDISFRRSLYMLYEPLLCTVSIRNMTGSDLVLRDTPRNPWFSFQIETVDGRPLQPVNARHRNEPLEIPAGGTVRRPVNLTPLYPIGEFGTYRVRAVVHVADLDRFFSSPILNIEITEGRLLWEETVGVPPGHPAGGSSRTFSLFAHRLPSSTMLYLRVRDRERGIIYCTSQIGRFLSFGTPLVLFDSANEIHILHNTAPKEFLYSHFNLDGRVRSQRAYQDWGSRPVLARTTEGGVRVVGGTLFDPKATPPERELPGLGDRPVDLPAPGATPPPKDEERPENLLSE